MSLFIDPYVSLALGLLAVGIAMCAATVFLLARSLARPPRMTDGKAAWILKRLSPGDLGLPFEEIAFDIRDAESGDRLRIAGWWIGHPQAQGRCVILLHGYADAKVGAIAWAPTWHALGWNILAIDLRAHGESGGRYCTGGYLERHDVSDVINLLQAQRPKQSTHLVLFGVSFGAAVAVATAAQRTDINAVILDSPIPDFAKAAMLQMDRLGAPGGVLRRLAVKVAERITGAKFNEVRTIDLLPRLNCPVLIVVPEHEPLLEDGTAEALRAALEARPADAGPGVYWQIGGAAHLRGVAVNPEEYRRRLDHFLSGLPGMAGDLPHAARF